MKVSIFGTAVLVLCTTAVFAQTATPTTTTPAKPATIQERKNDQQERIGNGVKSGQLTPHETANLENKEAGVNHEERTMKKLDNGHLTAADRKALNQQQNKLSKQIYRDKHNAAKR